MNTCVEKSERKKRYISRGKENTFLMNFAVEILSDNKGDLENIGRKIYRMIKKENKIRYPIKVYKRKLSGKEPFEPQEIIPLLYVTGYLNRKFTLEECVNLYLEQMYEKGTQVRSNAEKRITELLKPFFIPNISDAQQSRINALKERIENEPEHKRELEKELEEEMERLLKSEDNFPVHKYFTRENTFRIRILREIMFKYFGNCSKYKPKFDKRSGFTAVEILVILFLTGSLTEVAAAIFVDALYDLNEEEI